MPKQIDDIKKHKIRVKFRAGEDVKGIAAEFDVSEQTVRNYCTDLAEERRVKIKALKQSKKDAEAGGKKGNHADAPSKRPVGRPKHEPKPVELSDEVIAIIQQGGLPALDLLMENVLLSALATPGKSKEAVAAAYSKLLDTRYKYYPRTNAELAEYMLSMPDFNVNGLMRELYKIADKAE